MEFHEPLAVYAIKDRDEVSLQRAASVVRSLSWLDRLLRWAVLSLGQKCMMGVCCS